MFDQTKYKAAFSKVKASRETYQEVMNMTERNKTDHHWHSRKLVVLIAAILSLTALAVTTFASEEVAGWFEKYFAQRSDQPLSTEQMDYIYHNVQTLGQSQTHDGFTLELKSAISDGRNAYITVGITAPEEVTLLKYPPDEYDPNQLYIVMDEGTTPVFTNTLNKSCSGGIMLMEDNDGLPNTIDVLFYLLTDSTYSEDYPFSSDIKWRFYISGIYAEYSDRDKLQEVLDAHKEFDGEYLILTAEESRKCSPRIPVVKESYEFTFYFEDTHIQEVEFVTEPISISSIDVWTRDEIKTVKDVRISSFTLRSLSATIQFEDIDGIPNLTPYPIAKIYAVMKDGSQVTLVESHGSDGIESYIAQSPIILENVDHILLPDGTKLPAPETN